MTQHSHSDSQRRAEEVAHRTLSYLVHDSIGQLAAHADGGRLTVGGTPYEVLSVGRNVIRVRGPRGADYFIGMMPRRGVFYVGRHGRSREFTMRDVAGAVTE